MLCGCFFSDFYAANNIINSVSVWVCAGLGIGGGGGCCGGSFRFDSESASESDSILLDLDVFALDLDCVDLLGHAFLLLGLDLPVLDPVDLDLDFEEGPGSADDSSLSTKKAGSKSLSKLRVASLSDASISDPALV